MSTVDQAETGHGLAAQEAVIRHEVATRGWNLAEIVRDEGESGKTLERPGISYALQAIAEDQATGLVVSKLDRLSRSALTCSGDYELAARLLIPPGMSRRISDKPPWPAVPQSSTPT